MRRLGTVLFLGQRINEGKPFSTSPLPTRGERERERETPLIPEPTGETQPDVVPCALVVKVNLATKNKLTNVKCHPTDGLEAAEHMDSQSRHPFKPGDITWIKIHDSWWPAQVLDEESVGDKPQKTVIDESLVRLYGTYDYLYVDILKCCAEFESVCSNFAAHEDNLTLMLKQENKTMREVFQKSLKQDQSLLKSGGTSKRKLIEFKDGGAAESSKGKTQMQDNIESNQVAIISASPEATLDKSEVRYEQKEKDDVRNKSLGQKKVKSVIARKLVEAEKTQIKVSEAKSMENGSPEEQAAIEMAKNVVPLTKDTKQDGVRRSSRINAISEDKSMTKGTPGEQITTEMTRNRTSVTKDTKQGGVRRSCRLNAISEDNSMKEGTPGEQITTDMTRNRTSVTKGTKQDGIRRSSHINAISEYRSIKEGTSGEQITTEMTRNRISVIKYTKLDGVRRSGRINAIYEDKSMKEGTPGEQITTEMTRNRTSAIKDTEQDGVRQSDRINAISEDKSMKEGTPGEGEQITTEMTRNRTSVTIGTKQNGLRRSGHINTISEDKSMEERTPGEQISTKMIRNRTSVTKDTKQDGVRRSSRINAISEDKCMKKGMPGERITSKMPRNGTSVIEDTKQDGIRRSSRISAISEKKCMKEGIPGEQITTELARNGISVTNDTKQDGVRRLSCINSKEQMTDKVKNEAFPLRNVKAKQDKVAKGNVAKKARNVIARTEYEKQDDLRLLKSKARDAEIRAMVRDVIFKGRIFEKSEVRRSDGDMEVVRNVISDVENTKEDSFRKENENDVEEQVIEETSISSGVKTRSGASETEKTKKNGCRKRKHTDYDEQVSEKVITLRGKCIKQHDARMHDVEALSGTTKIRKKTQDNSTTLKLRDIKEEKCENSKDKTPKCKSTEQDGSEKSKQRDDTLEVAENFSTRGSKDIRKKLGEMVNPKKVKSGTSEVKAMKQNGCKLIEKNDVKKHLITEAPTPGAGKCRRS
ncbi:uncharacterized protein [Typha latifolia]|uniref:uncharacterized protein isoform X3 n=1 Tax=Typha latifolia TaxID=4733 RepID=UPI003C2D8033